MASIGTVEDKVNLAEGTFEGLETDCVRVHGDAETNGPCQGCQAEHQGQTGTDHKGDRALFYFLGHFQTFNGV